MPEKYTLERFSVHSESKEKAIGYIRLKNRNGAVQEKVVLGHGPIDASFRAIDAAIQRKITLQDFKISAIGSGQDAQGEVFVKISDDSKAWNGYGISTDIVEASIKAYLAAINAMEWEVSSYE